MHNLVRNAIKATIIQLIVALFITAILIGLGYFLFGARVEETMSLISKVSIGVSNGKEAVEIFEKSEEGYFGVIYMDILMPNMNGLDATREIRALNRKDAKKVPIIAVSANTFSDDVFESRMAGMNKHLGKPLDEEKMIKAYKQCAVLSEEPIKLNGDL